MKRRYLVPWFVYRRDYGVMRQRRYRWKPRVGKFHPMMRGCCSWMRAYKAHVWVDRHTWGRKPWINPEGRA